MVMWLSAPHTDIRRHGTGLSRRDFNDVIRNIGDCGGIVPRLNSCIQMHPDFRRQVEMKVSPDTSRFNKWIHAGKR